MEESWFGFRAVTGPLIWHGFKRRGEKSMCGRVQFGPQRRADLELGRPCKTCAAIWHTKYPKPSAVA